MRACTLPQCVRTDNDSNSRVDGQWRSHSICLIESLPRGAGVKTYERDVEEAYLVLEGCVTASWQEGGRTVEQQLGPRDLILNPPGQPRSFRNNGFTDAQFMMVVGTPERENVKFQPA